MPDKCPKCDGYLYGSWHTNIPGASIGREADDAICLMTGMLRHQLAQAKALGKRCCVYAGIDPELPDEAMVQAFAGLRQDLKLNASMLSTQMDLEAAQAENATAMTKALSEAAECFDKYPSSCKWSAAQLRRLAEQAEQEKP